MAIDRHCNLWEVIVCFPSSLFVGACHSKSMTEERPLVSYFGIWKKQCWSQLGLHMPARAHRMASATTLNDESVSESVGNSRISSLINSQTENLDKKVS